MVKKEVSWKCQLVDVCVLISRAVVVVYWRQRPLVAEDVKCNIADCELIDMNEMCLFVYCSCAVNTSPLWFDDFSTFIFNKSWNKILRFAPFLSSLYDWLGFKCISKWLSEVLTCFLWVGLPKPDRCPQFGSPEPLLIPVGFEIPISFHGRNLDIYTVRWLRITVTDNHRLMFVNNVCRRLQGRRFTIGTQLMKNTEKEVTQEQGSKFKFTGYEVSVWWDQENVQVNSHLNSLCLSVFSLLLFQLWTQCVSAVLMGWLIY